MMENVVGFSIIVRTFPLATEQRLVILAQSRSFSLPDMSYAEQGGRIEWMANSENHHKSICNFISYSPESHRSLIT